MAVQRFNGESLPEDFVKYIQKRAFFHAVSLFRSGWYRWDQVEDLRQDILVDLLQRLPRFRPSLGDPYAFAYSVMKNRASVLARRNLYDRRTVSLHEVIWRQEDDAESRTRCQEPQVEDFVPSSDLKIDVDRAVDRLPTALRGLARDLKYMTVPEICARRGKSRSRVYQMMREIKSSFIERGLSAGTHHRRKSM